ncbi:MAG TPA: hypothetical protein VGP87_11380 [Gemmatimonadales bacterium]|nr:hypothetical protein [Gemmatimonadales bacterium]
MNPQGGDVNALELRVCGLQRSGNHAIISWVLEQFSGRKACFLNNIRHGDFDPYAVAPQRFSYGMDDVRPEDWATTPKDLLIYSYEDCAKRIRPEAPSLLASAFSPEFEANRERYLGRSTRRLDVLILRDAPNLFASRLKKLERLTGVKDLPTIARYWKELARAVLAVETGPQADTVAVLYPRWFSDKAYRQQLSRFLGGTFSDASIRQVSAIGGGSSFDKTSKHADLTLGDAVRKWRKFLRPSTYLNLGSYFERFRGARRMKVLERYKEFEQDQRMQEILSDPELLQLSRRIFGEDSIPPTASP